MFRLNQRAYNILKSEVERLAAETKGSEKAQLALLLQQLKQMRFQRENPASANELTQIFSIYPNIATEIIKKAAKANQKRPLYLTTIPITVSLVTTLTAIICLVNLHYSIDIKLQQRWLNNLNIEPRQLDNPQ